MEIKEAIKPSEENYSEKDIIDAVRNTNLKHIAIIMDGNRRWAKERMLPSMMGHKRGVDALKKTARACSDFGVKYLTLYAFSTENWKRSKEEVNCIFDLIRNLLNEERESYSHQKIKLVISGDISSLPKDLVESINEVLNNDIKDPKLTLNICLNYGGRADIVRAVNKLIAQGKKSINEDDITNNLYSAGIPDLDFVIRTSGEQRISNFMIYQLAYAELYFPKIYWPEFNEKKLKKALKVFAKRNRRYGGY